MNSRVTPNKITELGKNEIFVFGSNLSGIHGAGAAKTARKWGAKLGQPIGLQGNTYAIPTKDENVRHTLSLNDIKDFVDDFILFAKQNPKLTFLVTEIGCGLAGLTPNQVAPLFANAATVQNIHLPLRFWQQLN